jgi:sphinganine-1-phosphate aldolase
VVPVDRETDRADAAAMADAVDGRTVLVVASAPSYAHGVIDPVVEIAAAAAERDVLCHVDACIGGWLLPYLRRAGREVPPFEMTSTGVTSLSVDLHKYGYADKGASVVLYRDAELRRHQYFAHARWPGYPVVNPTVQGTKSAGLLAQAWAVMRHIGDDGYTELARQVAVASDRLLAGLAALEGVRVLGRPACGLVAFTLNGNGDGGRYGDQYGEGDGDKNGDGRGQRGADEGDLSDPGPDLGADSGADSGGDLSLVLHLADELRIRGWYLQPQLGFEGMPPNLHLTLTPAVVGQVDALLADLREALAAARALAPVRIDPQVAELAGTLDPSALGPDEAAAVLSYAGLDGDGEGDGDGPAGTRRMAPVLVMLDALPAPLKERLLAEFVGSVFRI